MKKYACNKCESTDVFLKPNGNQTGLYCGDCGAWIKWVGKSEVQLVQKFIEENKKNPGANYSILSAISVESANYAEAWRKLKNYLELASDSGKNSQVYAEIHHLMLKLEEEN
jgi:hypothetical protein